MVMMAASLCAQSLDANTPAPVRSNSVDGRISARDIGDSRMTNHYFAFTGTPGDLLITVQTQNLNGDIDVFTAGTLRPLLKITLYAESSSPVTKGIYLRKRESLVLRVEARSPNDDEGTYRLSFGGSFEPIIGGPEIAGNEAAETPKTETRAPSPGTRRVSTVGARIAEPDPPPREVATATPEPAPEPTPEAKPSETPAGEVEKPAETENVKPAPTRTPRGRRPAARRPSPRATETARQPVEEPKPEEPRSARRPGTRSTATTRKPVEEPKTEEPKPDPAPEIGPRLVIETSDGTLINRPMSGVKRVTVENGQVVIVGRDGKINRVLLADVVRMTIAP
jgi:hypothetical protein